MALAPTSVKVAIKAYNDVFGKDVKNLTDLSAGEKSEFFDNIVRDVALFDGLYPNETEAQAAKREAIKSARSGQAVDIASYFKELYPEMKKDVSYLIIYRMKKLALEILSSKEPSVVEQGMITTEDKEPNTVIERDEHEYDHKTSKTDTVGEGDLDSGVSDKDSEIQKSENIKEKDMAENLKDLAEKANTQFGTTFNGIGNAPDPTLPTGTTASRMTAINNAIAEQKQTAKAYYQSHKIDHCLVPNFRAVDLLKDGKAALGMVRNPEKAMEDFAKKVGLERNKETGVVSFTKLTSQDAITIATAEEIYNILAKAKVTPEDTTVEMNISEKFGQFKALHIVSTSADKAAVKGEDGIGWIKWSEAPRVLATRAHGGLMTTNEEVTFSLDKAIKKTTKVKKDVKGSNQRNKTANPFSGVATVRCNNKDLALESLALNTKVKTDSTEVGGRFSSKVFIEYQTTADANGAVDTKKYRLPLKASVYKTENNIADPNVKEYIETFGESRRSVGKFNFDEAAENPELSAVLQSVLIKLSEEGTDAYSKDLRGRVDQAATAAASDQAAKMSNAGVDTDGLS